MKIVVKHIDNLKSTLIKNKTIPEYLIYTMTDDDIPINCINTYGTQFKDMAVKTQQLPYNFTLPVYEVSYNQNKTNILKNKLNNVRNK